MQSGGFLDKRTSPVGLGLVIAGHAAVLTAIALAPPEMVERIRWLPPLVVGTIDDAPPPPPLPIPRTDPRERPTATDRIVDTPIGLDPIVIPPPPLPPGPDPIGQIAPPRPDPVFVQATIEPSAMARFQPDYPSALVRAEIEGSATVRVLVGVDGRVKAVELASATDPGFFDVTRRQALRYWQFKPATRDGVAIESWRTMTVRFTLRD